MFGRKIGVLKQKREARHAKQASDRTGVGAVPAALLEQAPPTISWDRFFRARFQTSSRIQVLQFADNTCLLMLAAVEGGL